MNEIEFENFKDELKKSSIRNVDLFNFLNKLSLFYGNKSNSRAQIVICETVNYFAKNRGYYDSTFYLTNLRVVSFYFKLGDYEKALNSAKNIEFYSLKFKQYQYLIESLQVQVKLYIAINQLSNAKLQLKKAQLYIKKVNSQPLLGDYYRTNAYFFLSLKEHENSINSFKLAFEVFKKIGYNNQCSLQLLDIGYVYYENFKDYKTSLKYYLQSLDYNNDNNISVRLHDNIGACYWKINNFEKALEYYQKGLKLNAENLNKNPNYNFFKTKKLKQFYLTLLEDKAICWLDYYKATKIKSRLVHALETYELADKLVDLMRQEHTGTLSKYFWRNKTRSLYENAIETCHLLKDYEKAYYFMEKSRAVMLNDKLNELGAKQKLNEIDQEREREYQRKIIELNTKIEAETKATEKEKFNSQLFDLQEQQERFVKSLETKYPAYYQLKYNTQIGTLKQMQAYLKTNFKDKNATLVSYFFGDSASYAMVISSTKVEVKQFKYDVAQNQEFVNLLATNQGTKADYARILSMGSVIYQKLIKPLNIPKGHLIISQDGVFMPFEALSTSATSAQYLLKDYAISYTYSGQFLLKKATETKFWPNQTFVGFAPVEFKNQLNTLKNSDLTLGNVAKNYWFSDTFTGKVATKAHFLLQAKDHKIVQIFTHAFADSVDAEPKIYFADQALKISELNAEDQFNTQLLVLSACKTGVGKLAKGEGVLSLARGFSMLGIPATITSLWSVEDKNTYQLTELFYKYLNQGLSKDEALQKAKLKFMELHPNSGPTDWAGMVLVGETDAISSNYYLYFTIFLISVLILFLGFRYFYRKNALNKNPFYEP